MGNACPMLQRLWKARRSSANHADLTTFCAYHCPRLDAIPKTCPEALGDRYGVCVVWRREAQEPEGKCDQPCPCMQPADDEWNAAYEKWLKPIEHVRRLKPIWAETDYDPTVRML